MSGSAVYNDPVQRVLARLPDAKRRGRKWMATCPVPAHQDRDPSLSIGVGEKGVVLKCFGGCSFKQIVAALGLREQDMFFDNSGNGHGSPGLTLADYAKAKLLNPEQLGAWGVREITLRDKPVVEIRYDDGNGGVAGIRYRGRLAKALKGDGRFFWKRGTLAKHMLYGRQWIAKARAVGRLLVGEGESDPHCFWSAGIAAVGIPGVEFFEHFDQWESDFAGIPEILVIDEGDGGAAKMRAHLAKSKLRDRIRLVSLKPHKDAADLWRSVGGDVERFTAALEQAVARAEPVPAAEVVVGRPRLDADEKRLEIISSLAWAALLEANTPARLFLHGGRPARFEADGDAVAALQELTPERLRYELARAGEWWARRKVDGVWHEVPAMPPKDVVADMLAHPVGALRLPPVDRIVRAPVFAADGTLQAAPGYHPAGRVIVCPPEGLHMPDLPTALTDHDIEAAVALIDDLIADFPFVNGADRAAAFALLLVPFVRDMIDGPTPLHLFEAPAAGTGKGLLAAVALMAAIGDDLGTMTQGRDEDEWRKRISTCLREGKAAILIDNVTHALDSGVLSSALTATLWSDRLLGTLDPLNLPVRCAWVATGNNPTLSTEIARRSIRCRLDSKTDRPFQRDPATFRHPSLREWAREHRAALIGAALTLVQAWLAAGRPSPAVRPLGSYESWTRVIGGILHRAGIEQFLDNLDDLYERADSEGTVWRRFVEAWWEEHEGREVGVADLYTIAVDMEDFDLGKGQERSQKTVLGKGLARRADMVLGRFRIEAAGAKKRLAQWRLTPTRPGPPDAEEGAHRCT